MPYLGVCLLLAALGLWVLEFLRHPKPLLPSKGTYGRAAYVISPAAAATLAAVSGLFLIIASLTGAF